VYDDRSTWNVLPHKFEAGTPNAADAVGLSAAVDYLDAIGADQILLHERRLMASAQKRLSAIDDIRIFGPPAAERSGVLSFALGDVHPHDLATILDGQGVCIRAGHHCCQPLMGKLGVTATNRASFYLYTVPDEIDRLLVGLHKVRKILG